MTSNRPHVILITMDELRRDALGCYGTEVIDTPHIDRLAAEGTQFDRAYAASPICLPSRAAIMTGLYPHNSRTYSNSPDIPLNPDLPNLYTLLKSAGYATAHIGKCHYTSVPYEQVGPDRTLPYDKYRNFYMTLGIDHLDLQDDKNVSVWFRDDYAADLDEAGYLEAYRAAVWNRASQEVFTFPGPAELHPDAWTGRKAREHIENCDPGVAQFIWVSFSGPHWPFDPPETYLDRVRADKVGTGRSREGEFDDPRRVHHRSYHGPDGIEACMFADGNACKNYTDEYFRNLRRHYYANVAMIDDEIGGVMGAVREKLGDDVMIIVTCDHGEMLGNHRLWGKNNCGYDDVVRIPFILREPGPPAAKHSDEFVSLVDVLPTCLSVAGADPTTTDGHDLTKTAAASGRRYAFSEAKNLVAVTDGRYKYIHFRRNGETLPELFDLETDPGEFTNLAYDSAYTETMAGMRRAVIDFFMNGLLP